MGIYGYLAIVIEKSWSVLQGMNWRLWTKYGEGPLTLIPLILFFISVIFVAKYRQAKHSKKLNDAIAKGIFTKDQVFVNKGGVIVALDSQNKKIFLSGIDGMVSLSGIHDLSELSWEIEKRTRKNRFGQKINKWGLKFKVKSTEKTYDIRFGRDEKSCKNCLHYLNSFTLPDKN
jgi:hypothetical protein